MTVRIWLWVDLHRSRNWPWLHNVSTSDSLAKGEDYRLTVIANAPNPAGVAILKGKFNEGVVSAGKLLLAAIPPTVIAALAFKIL